MEAIIHFTSGRTSVIKSENDVNKLKNNEYGERFYADDKLFHTWNIEYILFKD